MSQLTRHAIMECTLDLAEKKSLRKITVRDIVSACGITRNTFYYHFHDIYDVLDQIIEEQVGALENTEGAEWESAIFSLIEFTARRKKVWRNLYRSVGHEEASRFVMARLHKVMLRSIAHLSKGCSVAPRDLEIICGFYEEALFGVMARWLENDKAGNTGESLASDIRRIETIFRGHLQLAIENARNHPEE